METLLAETPVIRPRNRSGEPGSLLLWNASHHKTILIIGDLHGRPDILNHILKTTDSMTRLAKGELNLLLLGDLVHDARSGQLENTRGSIEIIDHVMRLMVSFPGQVQWLAGNHDTFSHPLYKGGVRQELILDRAIRIEHGSRYRLLLEQFFSLLPLMMVHPYIVAVHGGPPKSKTYSIQDLVDSGSDSQFRSQLQWSRPWPDDPKGYTESDVQSLLEVFSCREGAFVVTGHHHPSTPASMGTVWRNPYKWQPLFVIQSWRSASCIAYDYQKGFEIYNFAQDF